jgi:hypothetical protein
MTINRRTMIGGAVGFASASFLPIVRSRGEELRSGADSTALSRCLRGCGSSAGPVAKGMAQSSYAGYRFPPEIIH